MPSCRRAASRSAMSWFTGALRCVLGRRSSVAMSRSLRFSVWDWWRRRSNASSSSSPWRAMRMPLACSMTAAALHRDGQVAGQLGRRPVGLGVGDHDRCLHGEPFGQQLILGAERVWCPAVHVEPTDALTGELEWHRQRAADALGAGGGAEGGPAGVGVHGVDADDLLVPGGGEAGAVVGVVLDVVEGEGVVVGGGCGGRSAAFDDRDAGPGAVGEQARSRLRRPCGGRRSGRRRR